MLRSDGLGCDGEGGHGDGDGAQIEKLLLVFLAVQNSSIGDLVPWFLAWANNQSLHNIEE